MKSAEYTLKDILPLRVNKKFEEVVSLPQTPAINIMFLLKVIIIWLLSITGLLRSFLFQTSRILNLDQHMLIHSFINKTKKSIEYQ